MKWDYISYNMLSYISYTIYSSFGYFGNPDDYGVGNVKINDLLYCYHALFASILTFSQYLIYPVN